MSFTTDDANQETFTKFKKICVPLLGTSRLKPSSVPSVLGYLSELYSLLHEVGPSHLSNSLVSYIFFPLSTILQRNYPSDIPDQIMEKVFMSLAFLCEAWWWDCDIKIWEQIFMLCGAVIGGIETKGKGKTRADETKEQAARCLFALLRPRAPEDCAEFLRSADEGITRIRTLQDHCCTSKFVPVFGQTLDSLLATAESRSLSLKRVSLDLLYVFIDIYAPEYLIPSILPGIASKTTKVCLDDMGKGWANGEIVARALKVLQTVVVNAIGDDVCVKDGAIHRVEQLEDYLLPATVPYSIPSSITDMPSFATQRTSSWLRGTATQLHIAINTLTPLVSHPSPDALHALSTFSSAVLKGTPLTLPQTQPLLLSFLLSLSISVFDSVSSESRDLLRNLLTKPSEAQSSLLETLMNSTSHNLLALPRLLAIQADAKVEHVAGLVTAVCRLSISDHPSQQKLVSISKGIAKLLGPSGGIEKWGWGLLSVLEFSEPSITMTQTSEAQLALENDSVAPTWLPFPELVFKNVSSYSTREALGDMFRALGRSAGEQCLYSVEWFATFGKKDASSVSVAAIWCACRLFEGVTNISLSPTNGRDDPNRLQTTRSEKLARNLAKAMAELWDKSGIDSFEKNQSEEIFDEDNRLEVQHRTGITLLHETLKITAAMPPRSVKVSPQPTLHRALCLQFIAVASGIIQARIGTLLIYIIYPILHSLVSTDSFLSTTALAALHFLSLSASYASPANLLLSNFDYVLDAVSRRLSRRWLDIDATKVLVVMTHLVGSDIVERAGDVVEECFDRLDEFHGYGVIVEGLIEVLGEIIKVIEVHPLPSNSASKFVFPHPPGRADNLNVFFDWFSERHNLLPQVDTADYGPAPQTDWGMNHLEEISDKVQDPMENVDPDAEQPPTPIQTLIKQIVSRSMYFLTHGSPVIRSRILLLLSSAVPLLPESALLPSIHSAWPFILNRLTDTETFVVSAAATLIEALTTNVGGFMHRRVWDDIWPRFQVLLTKLEVADSANALARKGGLGLEPASAYTHSHRLYRSLIRTMTAALSGVQPRDDSVWQVLLSFRRFLDIKAHVELQSCAINLYQAAVKNNGDAVWLILSATSGQEYIMLAFLREARWDINANKDIILNSLG